jgi:hypothetical protein
VWSSEKDEWATIYDKRSPMKIMDSVKAVAAGGYTTAAVKNDGGLWLWGGNGSGNIGDGTATLIRNVDGHSYILDNNYKYRPTKIMDEVEAVSVSYHYTAAIKTDGSLWAWGVPDNAREYNIDYYREHFTPQKAMDSVASVAAGEIRIAALKDDGSLWTWVVGSTEKFGGGRHPSTESEYTAAQYESVHNDALKTANIEMMKAHNESIYSNAGAGEAALKFYLLPTASIQSDNEKIIARSKTITGSVSGKYEQARAIHDWVAENLWYDSDAIKKGTYTNNTALDLVDGGIAVCEGYANLTIALLRAAGIPAKFVAGYALGNGFPDSWADVPESIEPKHAWVEAFIDNRWIVMDTTWDSANKYGDGEKTASGKAIQAYFDISVADLSADHKIIEYLPTYADDTTPPRSSEKPSSWAEERVNAAIAAELAPRNLQGNYTKPVARGDVARMFINLIEKSSEQSIDEFLTVKGVKIDDDAFSDTTDKAVLAANALGIISGVGDNRFDPSGTLTRAQIATIISRVARALDIDTAGYTHEFVDAAGHWADTALGWPVHAGILSGVGDNKFDPDGQLTTEQAIVITYRALQGFR